MVPQPQARTQCTALRHPVDRGDIVMTILVKLMTGAKNGAEMGIARKKWVILGNRMVIMCGIGMIASGGEVLGNGSMMVTIRTTEKEGRTAGEATETHIDRHGGRIRGRLRGRLAGMMTAPVTAQKGSVDIHETAL